MSAAVIAALTTAIVSIVGAISAAIVAIRSNGQAKLAAKALQAHLETSHGPSPALYYHDSTECPGHTTGIPGPNCVS